ncbi:AAA domain-containing protein [Dunaliella salina]|uniref:AAA domain-containing protein n=1 Tax=Dunaliella salina TaxID=3046 RepID=A0ABQ7H9X5_DUNSA|nr:AAA domain-containing protein [Dunaliella salina]|eukprot:KAF5843656.1 AAA domain-containing protein [Dunaliella salina]
MNVSTSMASIDRHHWGRLAHPSNCCRGLIPQRLQHEIVARASKSRPSAPAVAGKAKQKKAKAPQKPSVQQAYADVSKHLKIRQAKAANKRVTGVAEQRLQRLKQQSLELDLDALEPFSKVVQRYMAAGASRLEGKARGRGAKKSSEHELLDAYAQVFGLALDLELQEEWEESEGRLRTWSRARLETEGLGIFELFASADTQLFKDTIIRLYLPNRLLPNHQFSQGDIVLLSQTSNAVAQKTKSGRQAMHGVKDAVSPIDMDNAFEAVVVDYSARWLRVALPSSVASAVRGSSWRMDMYANTVGYERGLASVQRFAQGPAPDAASAPAAAGAPLTKSQATLDLWCLLSGALPAGFNSGNGETNKMEALASQPAPWTRGNEGRQRILLARQAATQLAQGSLPSSTSGGASLKRKRDAKRIPTGLALPAQDASDQLQEEQQRVGQAVQQAEQQKLQGEGLNASQANAVRSSLGRVLSLWQGPPGSGKTRTLLRLIMAAVAGMPKQKQVLATAASNVAVDNMVAGLVELGVDVVRMGQPVKVDAALRGCSLESRIAATPGGQKAHKLRQGAAKRAPSEAWLDFQEAQRLEEEAARAVLFSCQVVACTCIGAGDPRLQVESLLLVGDPQQLPPTVRSRSAEQLGLGTSLFLRLQTMGMKPMLLDTQYRMHPLICAFPSKVFYQGLLKSHPTPQDRPMLPGFPWPNPKVPVCFIPVTGSLEERTSNADDVSGHSLRNRSEAQQVLTIVQQLLAGRGLPRGLEDIGIISPYQGQVWHLQQVLGPLSSSGRFGKGRGSSRDGAADGILTEDAATGSSMASLLEIKSVDGFQGREKEVIVFSTVRSNATGSVGFLSDYRRLNVAITRAKRGLIVVGNPDTLKSDSTWNAWLRWAAQHQAWMKGVTMQGDDSR